MTYATRPPEEPSEDDRPEHDEHDPEAQEHRHPHGFAANAAPIFAVPYAGNECRCIATHNPAPLFVEKHHVFPQADQLKLWGSVRDGRTVNLCPTGHDVVHAYMRMLARGEKFHVGNLYLYRIARTGLARAEYSQRTREAAPDVPLADLDRLNAQARTQKEAPR